METVEQNEKQLQTVDHKQTVLNLINSANQALDNDLSKIEKFSNLTSEEGKKLFKDLTKAYKESKDQEKQDIKAILDKIIRKAQQLKQEILSNDSDEYREIRQKYESEFIVFSVQQLSEDELSLINDLRSKLKLDLCMKKEVIDSLKERIILPTLFPHFFTGLRTYSHNTLLFGPNGCGKKTILKAIANEAKIPILNFCKMHPMYKAYEYTDSERAIKEMFKQVKFKTGYIILFEDVEDWFSSDEKNMRCQKTELLIQMSQVKDAIFTVFTSSKPWELNPFLRRRLDHRIYIPYPERQERFNFLKKSLDSIAHQLTSEDFEQLAESTEGFNFQDIRNKVIKPTIQEYLITISNNAERISSRPLELKDFMSQISQAHVEEFKDKELMEGWISNFC